MHGPADNVDRNQFTENVFRGPGIIPAIPPVRTIQPAMVTTRSGRVSQPIIGKRLIDQVLQN